MNKFFNSIINLNYYTNNYINNIKQHEEVLEPFCTIIKLVLLSYKPDNTKISITNNSILYQEPTFIQSTIRWKNGDKREHIHNLYNPIKKFLLWYDINDIQIQYILKSAMEGLSKLVLCYKNLDSVTVHSLKYYIELIDTSLKNIDINNNININDDDIYYVKFKHLWQQSQINIIYNILLEINKTENVDKQIYINTIEYIINEKEKIIHEIVHKISTTL